MCTVESFGSERRTAMSQDQQVAYGSADQPQSDRVCGSLFPEENLQGEKSPFGSIGPTDD